MTRYLSIEQVFQISAVACGGPKELRDLGLLDSAVHRPQAAMFGQEAYPDVFSKAAALLQSLAIGRPFVDGNKRTAWLATTVFLRRNEVMVTPDDGDAYKLVGAVAAGAIFEVEEISAKLRAFVD